MNNEDKGYTIYCPRCGADMNSNSRYCMKCGYLNTEHEANESMKKYIKENSESYQVGSGGFVGENTQTSIGNNTGNRKLCFAVNFSIYMLITIISTLLVLLEGNMNILYVRDSILPIILIVLSIMFLYIYSIELIFMKCNKPWWSGLIPIYNFMVLSEILYKKKMLGLITLIPIVGQIYLLIMIYTLGKKFKYNGLLTVILSFVFIPIIGFGTSLYMGRSYVDELNQKEIERNYQRKRMFLFFILLFLLIGIGLFVWKNMNTVSSGTKDVEKSYYLYAAKNIVKHTKHKIDGNYFTCEGSTYYENTGIYYFQYSDLGDYIYLPLYYQREPISGYVKVDNSNGKSKYYVSLTDGTTGFDELLIDDLSTNDVVKFNKLKGIDSNTSIICRVK